MRGSMKPEQKGPPDIKTMIANFEKPKKAIVTGGMPYANGPLHLGHLAGAMVPPDVYARWMRMLIGDENVLFVCGTDDHGSTSEVAALQAGKTIREFIDSIHVKQKATLDRYGISPNTYSGTSRPECFPVHSEYSQNMLRDLHKNGMLEKRVTKQWYDPKVSRFLQDRFVRGLCPNPKCGNEDAYSDECDKCGSTYEPTELQNPRSMISDAKPELRETAHWWLDMWKVAEPLKTWIDGKEKTWRQSVFSEVSNTVIIGLRFENVHEPKFKELRASLPKHKSRYVAGKKVEVLFDNKADLETGRKLLEAEGITSVLTENWAHRPITRDVSWGIPVPPEIDPEMKGKTLYVWPDSLIAPIAFTQVALKQAGRDPGQFKEFWCDPEAQVYQFLGQDNVFFYVIMQGALWLGSQKDPGRLPVAGERQLTDVFSCYHLMVNGEKMSKSKGNFFTADQLIDEKGYSADQIRYFLALLSLPVKASNFDFETLDERNKFLAGPLNAAFEKPISAVHSKFGGRVPDGKVMEKVEVETQRIVARYLK